MHMCGNKVMGWMVGRLSYGVCGLVNLGWDRAERRFLVGCLRFDVDVGVMGVMVMGILILMVMVMLRWYMK